MRYSLFKFVGHNFEYIIPRQPADACASLCVRCGKDGAALPEAVSSQLVTSVCDKIPVRDFLPSTGPYPDSGFHDINLRM
jgi:hypothetical protein